MSRSFIILARRIDNDARILPLQLMSAIAVYHHFAVAGQRRQIVELAAPLVQANGVVAKNSDNDYRHVTEGMYFPLPPNVNLLKFLRHPDHRIGLCTS